VPGVHAPIFHAAVFLKLGCAGEDCFPGAYQLALILFYLFNSDVKPEILQQTSSKS
jgi:hypothetical protein